MIPLFSSSVKFLFKSEKNFRGEKFRDCNSKSIAQLLDCDYADVFAFTVDDVVNGGLGYSRNIREFVDCNLLFVAKFDYAICNSI